MDTLRVLLSLAARRGLRMRRRDLVAAFLQGCLEYGRLNHTCPSIHTLPVLPGLVPDFSARRAELVAPPCIFDLFRRFT